jgi:hypothetical protein
MMVKLGGLLSCFQRSHQYNLCHSSKDWRTENFAVEGCLVALNLLMPCWCQTGFWTEFSIMVLTLSDAKWNGTRFVAKAHSQVILLFQVIYGMAWWRHDGEGVEDILNLSFKSFLWDPSVVTRPRTVFRNKMIRSGNECERHKGNCMNAECVPNQDQSTTRWSHEGVTIKIVH